MESLLQKSQGYMDIYQMKSQPSIPDYFENSYSRNHSTERKGQSRQQSNENTNIESKNYPSHMISFYGNSSQLQQIQLVKNSIASAYLQNESSLSPFIQAYFKQSVNIESPSSKMKSIQNSMRNQSDSSKIQIPRSTVHHQQRAKTTIGSRDSPVMSRILKQNSLKKFGQSPQKIKQSFIQDKLARMKDISGDVSIEKDLEIMRRNISSAQSSLSYQEDCNPMQSRKKQQSEPSYEYKEVIKMNNHYKVDQEQLKSNNDSGDKSHQRQQDTIAAQLRAQFNPCQSFQKEIRNQPSESPSHKGRFDHSFQALFSLPQNSELDRPIIQKRTISCSADPNNNMLNKYFHLVQNVNQDNLFVNSIGISEEQKKTIIENMQPVLRSSVLETYAVKDQVSKSSKAAMNGKIDFSNLFMNSRKFISNQPSIQTQLHQQPLIRKQNNQISGGENSKKTKQQLSSESDKTAATFLQMANPNFGKRDSCLYSLLSQQKSTKKEYPLYINRVNRIRNGGFELNSEKRRKVNQLIESYSDFPSKNNLEADSLIDPRFIYRRNLEIMSKSSSLKQRINPFEEQNRQEIQQSTNKGLHHSLIYSDLDVKGLPI